MRADIASGGTFPDYELPDHTSVPRRLSELQGDDPLILTLARGSRFRARPSFVDLRHDLWKAEDLPAVHGWTKWSPLRASAARST